MDFSKISIGIDYNSVSIIEITEHMKDLVDLIPDYRKAEGEELLIKIFEKILKGTAK